MRPIFIFGTGWRCGSTLIQRLLCSHPDVHIWGENRGICDHLQKIKHTLDGMRFLSRQAEHEFGVRHAGAWIAMLNPEPSECLDAIATFLDRYLGVPARTTGKHCWGFKEVRHGWSTVAFLRAVFPLCRCILVVRNPASCLASARATEVEGKTQGLLVEVGGPTAFLRHWRSVASSFARDREPGVMLVRYEDIQERSATFIEELAQFVDVSTCDLSPDVLKTVRRGWLEQTPRLAAVDREALQDPDVWAVAQWFGYVGPGQADTLSGGSLASLGD
ncbi:MAG: hypothetical protein ABS36_00040 [Acidobacteria bacterium SCN 69-37]|nr:MAG: hypothetical protein ABS36_00040 [Acidobacteria bacterium SCN 69-37]